MTSTSSPKPNHSAEEDRNKVSDSIQAMNPDLETAWRKIAWWEQTCDYWRNEALKGYALRDSLITSAEKDTE